MPTAWIEYLHSGACFGRLCFFQKRMVKKFVMVTEKRLQKAFRGLFSALFYDYFYLGKRRPSKSRAHCILEEADYIFPLHVILFECMIWICVFSFYWKSEDSALMSMALVPFTDSDNSIVVYFHVQNRFLCAEDKCFRCPSEHAVRKTCYFLSLSEEKEKVKSQTAANVLSH